MMRRSQRLRNKSENHSDDFQNISTEEDLSSRGRSSKNISFNRSSRRQHNTGSQSSGGSHHATGKRILNSSLSQISITSDASDTSSTCSVLDGSLIHEQTEVGHLWGKVASGLLCWLGTGWYQLTTLFSMLSVIFLTRWLPKMRRFLLLLTPLLLLLGLWFWGCEALFPRLPAQNGSSLNARHISKFHIPALAPESDVLCAHGKKDMDLLFDAQRISKIEKQLAAIADDQSRQMEEYGKMMLMILKIQEQVVQALEERQKEAQPITSGSEIKDMENDLLIRIQNLEKQIAEHNAAFSKEQTAEMSCGHADCVLQRVDTKVRESIQATFASNENLPESLLQLLSTNYMSEEDFTAKLQETELRILKKMTHHVSMTRQRHTLKVIERAVAGCAPGITEEEARVIVNNALELYSQDRTGMVDFALESGGGSILGTRCSETYEKKTTLLSIYGFPLWHVSTSPRVVIQPDMYPGNCWAIKGSQGYLVVQLSTSIYPTAFSIEHLPKAMSPHGNILSAPKDFAIYGLEDEYQQEGTLLVRNVYDDNGEPLQIFQVMALEERQKEEQAITSGSEIKDTENDLLLRIQNLETQIAEHNAAFSKEQTAEMNCGHADCVLQRVDTKVRESIQTTFASNENLPESLLELLSINCMSEEDFTAKLQETELRILKKMTHHVSMTRQKHTLKVIERAGAGCAPCITEEEARVIVNNALELYSQDRTGMVDFALESGGGSILGTSCSETYEKKTTLLSIYGFPLWHVSTSPRVVIQPDMYTGNCWAIKGSQGYLVVQLSTSIYPTAFSIEHLPKAMSPTGNILSAPKDFAIYGLEDEYQQEGTLLVRNVYDDIGEPLQIFQVMEENQKSFNIVENSEKNGLALTPLILSSNSSVKSPQSHSET